MATIAWGKPKVEICMYVAGVMPTTPVWTAITPIKQDTTKLTTTPGTKQEAKEEGGGLVDVRNDKNSYKLELEMFATKGSTKPIEDTDGVVSEHCAVRLTPEDDTIAGFILDKTSVQVEDNFTAKDGETWKYTFEGLIPATGKILKAYTKA